MRANSPFGTYIRSWQRATFAVEKNRLEALAAGECVFVWQFVEWAGLGSPVCAK